MMQRLILVGLVVLLGVVVTRNIGTFLSRQASSGGGPGVIEDWRQYANDGRLLGHDSARITIISFGDYRCTECRVSQQAVHRLLSQHPDEVALVVRHWPRDSDSTAYAAAMAAECAANQGQFAAYHRALLEDDLWLADPDDGLRRLAELAGIEDVVGFERCVETAEAGGRIERDIRAAAMVGGLRPPVLLINGVLLRGSVDSVALRRYVESGLVAAG
jgi:protein-disulfide isomerase